MLIMLIIFYNYKSIIAVEHVTKHKILNNTTLENSDMNLNRHVYYKHRLYIAGSTALISKWLC